MTQFTHKHVYKCIRNHTFYVSLFKFSIILASFQHIKYPKYTKLFWMMSSIHLYYNHCVHLYKINDVVSFEASFQRIKSCKYAESFTHKYVYIYIEIVLLIFVYSSFLSFVFSSFLSLKKNILNDVSCSFIL
jgi:hypothetical protein